MKFHFLFYSQFETHYISYIFGIGRLFVFIYISVPILELVISKYTLTRRRLYTLFSWSDFISLSILRVIQIEHFYQLSNTKSKNLDLLRFCVKENWLRNIGCINFAVLQAAKNVTWFETPEDGDEASGCQSFCGRLPSSIRAFVSKIVWLSSTARNAVVVVACALIAYGFDPVLPSSSCQQR